MYVEYVEDTKQKGFSLSYQHGSTFFTSGIYDYLEAEEESTEEAENNQKAQLEYNKKLVEYLENKEFYEVLTPEEMEALKVSKKEIQKN